MSDSPSTPTPSSTTPRLCPVCGTRVGEAATKCFVCGTDLTQTAGTTEKPKSGGLSFLRRKSKSSAAETAEALEAVQAEAREATGPTPAVARPEPPAPSLPPPPPTGSTGPVKTVSDASAPLAPVEKEKAKPARGRIAVPLPVLIILGVIFIMLAGLLTFNALGGVAMFATPTATVTPTATIPPTFTPQPTRTPRPTETPTPLPPLTHTVAEGESCISIAFVYDVSVQSILEINGFPQSCPLFVGQQIQVPQPTPTPIPSPTPTTPPDLQTQAAWPRHIVQPGESLSSIAAFFGIDFQAFAEVNGKLPPDYAIVVGEELIVPIDRLAPTAGPTPTPTPPPPYPAPSLLSPADGTAISAVEQTVTLQWGSSVALQANEFWLVTVEDVTANSARRISDTTTTNRYVVNVELKPFEASPHVFRWTVVAVRQVGVSDDGEAILEPAGATSEARTFTWTGIGIVPTPTP